MSNFKNNAIQIAVISFVEIGFGVLEGIIMPNIFEREYKEPLFLPKKEQILGIAGGLVVTGIASGVISDMIIANYEVKPENRAKVIIATAIAINLLETLYSYNVPLKDKFKVPTFKAFAPAFAVLVTTSIIGGNLSDYLIAKTTPAPGAPTESQMPQTELASI